MEATLKTVQWVNEEAKKIAFSNSELSIDEIEAKLPKVVDSQTGEVFSFDAAVSAWHQAHPKDPAVVAAEFEVIMGISIEKYNAENQAELDAADYSDAQD